MEFVYADEKNGARRPLIRAEAYSGRKYGGARVAALELGSNDFLIFEHSDRPRKNGGPEGRVVMSYPHLHRLGEGLENALAAFEACFERVDSRYFRVTQEGYRLNEPASMMGVEDLHAGGALGIAPDLFPAEGCEDDADPVGDPAVRLFVNGFGYGSAVSYETFRAFQVYYSNFDLSRWSGQAMAIAAQMGAQPDAERVASPQPRRIR